MREPTASAFSTPRPFSAPMPAKPWRRGSAMNKQGASPELILHNGRFATLAPSQPSAAAVAVAEGRFSAVGSDAEVLALRGPKTQVVDLGGRTVIPGLN